MKAIILAGGKGKRLAPYTTIIPKPLVPIGDRPILDIIIRQLSHYGIKNIILSIGYLGNLIQAYFQNNSKELEGVDITFSQESEPLGTTGPLALIDGLDDTFLVMNGDVLTTLEYNKLIEYHKDNKAILTIAMCKKDVFIDFGILEVDSNNNLIDYIEKPKKKFNVSMGIYVFEPYVLKYIKKNEYLDFPDLVLRLIKKGEKIKCYYSDAYWLDIGRTEDYIIAQKEFDRKKDKFLINIK